jgi:multidrug resistance efflux pump
MLIIIGLYLLLVWLVFLKFRLLPWNWPWRIATAIALVAIVGIFIGLLNRYAPAGRIAVLGRVIEIAPNVTGTVIAIPVATNALVEKDAVLFRIDPTPYEANVNKLRAELVDTRQRVKQHEIDVDIAQAEMDAFQAQLDHARSRSTDIDRLVRSNASSQFRAQDAEADVRILTSQMIAARGKLLTAQLIRDSRIGGVHTAILQLEAQVEDAEWQLEQTIVHAPSAGYVTLMALGKGHMAVQNKPAMSFIVADEVGIIGIFRQNGFASIKAGAKAMVVFADSPGRVYSSTILDAVRGVGEGQILATGNLERVNSADATKEYPVLIAIPDGIDRELLRPGVSGKVRVIAEDGGIVSKLGIILIRVAAWGAYL